MTPGACLRRAAREAPGQEAFVYRGRRITYAEWCDLSEQVAGALLARGLGKSDRVALVLPPRPEYGIAYVGAAMAGLVTAGVNPRLGNPEVAHILGDSRVAVTIDRFGGRDFAALIQGLRGELLDLEAVFLVEDSQVNLPVDASARPAEGGIEPFRNLLVSPYLDLH
ncbi:MAG: AMP-binding protein, partial [bacterium]